MPEINIRDDTMGKRVSDAAWSAYKTGEITEIMSANVPIAKIVPVKTVIERVLTINQLDELATLLRAVQAGARLRWYPHGIVGENPDTMFTSCTFRSFINIDGSLYPSDGDIRDAHVWITSFTEHFIPVSEMLTAIRNASTGENGHDKPMAVINWEGTP